MVKKRNLTLDRCHPGQLFSTSSVITTADKARMSIQDTAEKQSMDGAAFSIIFPSFFHPCSAIVIHCHPFVPSTCCNMLSIFYRFLHAIVELDPTGISLFHLLAGLLGTLYHGVLCHEQCRPTQMVGPQTREVQHDQRAASVYSKEHTQVEQYNIVKFCDSSWLFYSV